MPCLGHDCVSLRTSELRARVDAAAAHAAASPPSPTLRLVAALLNYQRLIRSPRSGTRQKCSAGQVGPLKAPGGNRGGIEEVRLRDRGADRRTTGPREASIVGSRPLTCAYASLRVPLPDLRRHLRTEPSDGGIRRSGGLSRRARRHRETPVDRRGRHRRVGVRARPAPLRRRRRRVLRRRVLRLTDRDFSGSLQLFFARIPRSARACRALRPYVAAAQAGHGPRSGHARATAGVHELPQDPLPRRDPPLREGGDRRCRPVGLGEFPVARPPAAVGGEQQVGVEE